MATATESGKIISGGSSRAMSNWKVGAKHGGDQPEGDKHESQGAAQQHEARLAAGGRRVAGPSAR